MARMNDGESFIVGDEVEGNPMAKKAAKKFKPIPASALKTAKQIVDEANTLARLFYEGHGYEVEEGYRFDQAHHPQEVGMWNLAAIAYEHIKGTDINDALSELDE